MTVSAPPFMVSSTLTGIVSQRLVRRLCRLCRQPVESMDETAAQFIGERAVGATLYKPVGCPACGGVGYAGRTVVEEALVATRAVRRLIREGAGEEQLADVARAAGMISLKESAVRLVLAGETTVDEVAPLKFDG